VTVTTNAFREFPAHFGKLTAHCNGFILDSVKENHAFIYHHVPASGESPVRVPNGSGAVIASHRCLCQVLSEAILCGMHCNKHEDTDLLSAVTVISRLRPYRATAP
jgi:hypothetical protein